ncbi:VOC family protein [Proteobacteria bacterium 005FR1]|nr:VOC family protein [Proteobacteria bacterium 005FR1]
MLNKAAKRLWGTLCLVMVAITAHGETQQAHAIGMAKLIVDDLQSNQAFYEKFFGLEETRRFDYAPDVFVESIMGFADSDAKLALLEPRSEEPLPKSQFPVVLIYTPEFDAVTERLKEAGHGVRVLPTGPDMRIAITRDPSGNTVEIYGREGVYEVGGAKLIVDSREKAEAFYSDLLGAEAGQRFVTDRYDEVLMGFGSGPFLALFEPKAEAPLRKSRFPVVAIYTNTFDQVIGRLEENGVSFQRIATGDSGLRIVIFRDPAGNGVELISR